MGVCEVNVSEVSLGVTGGVTVQKLDIAREVTPVTPVTPVTIMGIRKVVNCKI